MTPNETSTQIPDELVEKAMKIGVYGDQRKQIIKVLEAVGLPALLERVEAAEAKVVEATGDEYELQQARMEALYERIADRLGEHDAARNVSEGPSEEQVTILTAGWPVEDLARFIVDALEYDFIAPIQRDALAAKVADAWDEGHSAGMLDGSYHLAVMSGLRPPAPTRRNPYRAALTEGTESA